VVQTPVNVNNLLNGKWTVKEARLGRVIRMEIIDAVTPDAEEVFGLIVRTEAHRKVVWTAGRVLRGAALWSRVKELDYEERKIVLKRITGFLGDLASRGFFTVAVSHRA
jgi:hypothetical protein